MKFGIITHYDVHNHGAILQMNALKKVLEQRFNIAADILQYTKNYDFMGCDKKYKYEFSIKSIKQYIYYLRSRGVRLFLFNVKKKIIFERFKKDEKLTGDFYSKSKTLDGIVIGSDEVFALHTGPTPALFGYALPSDKVFSYAGSFGPTTLEEINSLHCTEFVRGGLSGLKGMGMRDLNSIHISETLTGRKALLTVDPVILYGYKKELSICKPINKKYVLVYAYETRMNNKEEYQHIIDFAHKKGLKVVCPGFYHKWADKNVNVSPTELLRWFKYSEYVITDTFHGAVLSMITGREMAVKIRDNANKLKNLLSEYNLEHRVIDDNWNLSEVFSAKLDITKINNEIAARKKTSMEYLKSMIEL